MNIRYNVFALLDKLSGGNTLKDVLDIRRRVESGLPNTKALEDLLKHATESVPAYSGLKGICDLSKFPVVNKSILRDNLEQYLSSKYNKKSLTSTTTSGSTGTPFTAYFDGRKVRRHRAALIYWNSQAGAPIGQRLYYLRVWNNLNKKGGIKQLIENIIPIEVSHFDKCRSAQLVREIENYDSPVAILGFASAISELVRFERTCPTNLKGIITMSEHMSEGLRQDAIFRYGIPVIARYSNMENGFMAQQTKDSGAYLINTADFYIEILKLDKDESTNFGEKGRIVVTDLFNYAMPFVRYDTGDIGAIEKNSNGQLILTTIEGRKTDVITDTIGNIVSSHVVTNTFWLFPDIIQFQFVQNGQKNYKIVLNTGGGKSSLKHSDELVAKLKTYLGEDAEFTFEYVDEVPVLSSGKRRYIINNYTKL